MKEIKIANENGINNFSSDRNVSDGRLTERYSVKDLGEDPWAMLKIRNLAMDNIKVIIDNISETGMGISSRNELLRGQVVGVTSKINIEIPSMAVVMWSKKEDDDYSAGLKFLRKA